MRYTVVLSGENVMLNRYTTAVLIYQFLKRGNPEFAAFLHDNGYEDPVTKRKYKPFTFLPLRVTDGRRLDFVVSSSSPEFDAAFIGGIEDELPLDYQGLEFRVKEVKVMPRPALGEFVLFRTLTPVVATRSNLETGKEFLTGDCKDFSHLIKSNLVAKYRACTGKEPGDMGLTVVKSSRQVRKYKRDVFVIGDKLEAVMTGNPDVIKFAYYAGLGEKTSMGFGMVAC